MESMKEHKCQKGYGIDDEIKIIYGPSLNNDWNSWIIQISSIADEKEVEMGEAEFVG
jgi:hypothetical protein